MKRILLAVMLLIVACEGEENALGPDDAQFIETVVALRHAAMTAGRDTAHFEQLRDSVLESQGVTAEDLRTYVETTSADLEYMAMIWDSISARLSEPVPQ
ncbi:MAG TPA: hypothetical protein VHG09_05350 [Longimicrobiales bacterium]|nr:hypothetical protein [Longimicrobiales bacterium]